MYAIILHAHQKIDRAAYRHLRSVAGNAAAFPSIARILHFEGRNGPDATKLKRQTAFEQPWHFVDPFDLKDTDLHKQIEQHYSELVQALKNSDEIRAAFEAAWLAHALVDGLTPAHHYPYEKELEVLRGEARHTRKGLLGRVYVQGDSPRQSWQRSVKLIGPKGLLTNHALFEAGAYTIMLPMRFRRGEPTLQQLRDIRSEGIVPYFQRMAWEVARLKFYTRFMSTGWTPRLSRDVRQHLAPRMSRMVTLAWYSALCDAGVIEEKA
jgi:hypothetical protein